MENKRLYRSTTDRKIAGVAGGLAEYFNMDPLLVRLIFVVLTIAYGTSLLIYLVLWIVTPEKPYDFSKPLNQPNSENPQPPREEPKNPADNPKKENPFPAQSSRKKGSLIGGLILITLGALFLADEFLPNIDFGDLWPVILIVIGAGLLINAFTGRNKN
jgi:phage shock protein C